MAPLIRAAQRGRASATIVVPCTTGRGTRESGRASATAGRAGASKLRSSFIATFAAETQCTEIRAHPTAS